MYLRYPQTESSSARASWRISTRPLNASCSSVRSPSESRSQPSTLRIRRLLDVGSFIRSYSHVILTSRRPRSESVTRQPGKRLHRKLRMLVRETDVHDEMSSVCRTLAVETARSVPSPMAVCERSSVRRVPRWRSISVTTAGVVTCECERSTCIRHRDCDTRKWCSSE